VVTDLDPLKQELNGTHNPWGKATNLSPAGEIIGILWNLNVHYRVHSNKLMVRILSTGDGVFMLTSISLSSILILSS
jgi:hypothetical protein